MQAVRFGKVMRLPVRPPFRLDLTVNALRRLPANVVDLLGPDGAYYRAMRDASGIALVSVRAGGPRHVEVRATGRDAGRWLERVATMLGADVDLQDWYERSAAIEWVRPLAASLRGVKPPQYPSLWEACVHAIVFQQISLHAAAAIMQRFIEAVGEFVMAGTIAAYVFPDPQRCAAATDDALRSAGLSGAKVRALRAIAALFSRGAISTSQLQPLPTHEAALRLQLLPGIGPWSAAVALLRGLGRLDTFPLRDSGVDRSLDRISPGRTVDLARTLELLGPTRGMLYFHLLLTRLRTA